ncbi:MAG TPA: rRNA maturation RNase YbeY [Solirubrobacteraceae bacterium]|nr:rRNA maturation RNase YbeY [Solirubrobacteraceae bacterium]
MLEVEVLGTGLLATRAPSFADVRRLCRAAAAAAGVHDGHVAIEFVDAARITDLNREHRAQAKATDVLSFPIDGVQAIGAGGPSERNAVGAGGRSHEQPTQEHVPRELGDVVICPEHTVDVREAIVHGMLHLLGMDHETDGGEMLALQRRLLAGDRP